MDRTDLALWILALLHRRFLMKPCGPLGTEKSIGRIASLGTTAYYLTLGQPQVALAISAPRIKGCLMKSSKEHLLKDESYRYSVNSTPLKFPARLFG